VEQTRFVHRFFAFRTPHLNEAVAKSKDAGLGRSPSKNGMYLERIIRLYIHIITQYAFIFYVE
jgi:hypothetical protein